MSSGWKDVKDHFTIDDIGAPLLANLAKGIYTPEAMLREYVQNAGDAYFDLEERTNKSIAIDEKPIDIYYPEGATIAIQDGGIGMDLEDIKRYKRIALSSKLGKDRAGFRGIGIWAGFSACDELQVETTKIGDLNRYRLTLKFAEMRQSVAQNINIKELLDKRFKIEVAEAPKNEHYTQVRLVRLNEEFADLLRAEELERIACEILPCRFDPKFKHADILSKRLAEIDGYQQFAVKVEGTEVFKNFHTSCEEPEYEVLKRDDEEYAFVWYCKSPTMRSFAKAPSNFRLRVKNISVGGPGMYSTEQGTQWGISGTQAILPSGELLDWYFGEIHVTHPDVKPNTPRSDLELDATSRKAITEIRSFYGERVAFRRANSNVNSHKTQVLDTAQQIEDGHEFEADEKTRLLKSLKKYEQLSKSKAQAKDATAQEKILKYERKILKTLEAKEPEIAQKRRSTIEFLTTTTTSSTKTDAKEKADVTSDEISAKPASNGKPRRNPESASATSGRSGAPDFEQLLAEIYQVVEKRLADQDELATELCEGIEDIFKEHGLLVTA
jgi:hypothetical protein